MKLVIVESPAKSKTISKYLGKEYKVLASVGHVRDLPKKNSAALDIPGGFVPHYEVVKGKEKVLSSIIHEANKADEVLLATDPDREGEAIAWHVAETAKLKRAKRIVFHEITKDAVREALAHPRKIDQNLRKAQEARRVLDRLVGYDLSGLIWKKLRYGLSAGRVQSPALRIIVEREREIEAFIPENYWILTALLETSPSRDSKEEKAQVLFTCSETPKKEKEAKKILELAKKGKWYVESIKETQVARAPRPPFTTSTLQQAASSRLGYSPANTMRLAQRLYEAGHITYMRTDSMHLSKESVAKMVRFVENHYGKEYAKARVYKTKSKNAQEAHEAIRPTDASLLKAGKTADETKLYTLIRNRTLATQMSDAKVMRTKISANIKGGTIPSFSVNGSRLLFDGWLKIDPRAREDDVEVPKLQTDDPLALIKVESDKKQTEPPNRYSEAGLVKELEKRGIGRPSTYASTIKTLYDREYTEKEGRSLKPTTTGKVVSGFLEEHFANIISDTFTAEMEKELDEIASGERDYEKTLRSFYRPFLKEVKSKESLEKITTLGNAPKGMKCPKCKGKMIIKLGKSGTFFSCATFPDCDGSLTEAGEEMLGPKEIGEACPECSGALVERMGKYGKFIACGNYPKCKYIKKDASAALNGTGVKCPECKQRDPKGKPGEMVERKGRFGTFYSCSKYPDCKYAIKAKPTGRLCKECKSLMMEGTKTIPERCSNKACKMHNPHKLEKE